MTDKVFTVTGAALKKPRKARSTRKNRQEGGVQSGALLQLTAQSVPMTADPQVQSGAIAAAQATANALRQMGGPAAVLVGQKGGDNSGALMQLAASQRKMFGGDNSGALLQIAQVPQTPGPMNTQQFANTFRAQVAKVLDNNFGPAVAQSGGKKQRGGDGVVGTIQLRSSEAPTLPGAPPATPVISGVNPEQPAPVGGARVVLAPPKRRTRIALKAKKLRGGSESGAKDDVPPMFGGASAATKKARKIHLRVKGVTARLAKAKKAKKQAMAAPIGEVRSRLEAAKVIKKGSKAPEAMMRTMYADLLITKKGL
jgi:hypothetical protein